MENLAEENYPREFNLIEVLSIAWNIFSKNYFKLFGFIFSIAFPIAIINAIYINPSVKEFQIGLERVKNDPIKLVELISNNGESGINNYYIVDALLYSVLFSFVIFSLKEILFSNEFVNKKIIINTLMSYPRMFVVALIYIFITILGFCFFIVPGIAIYTYYYFVIISILTDNKTITDTFKSSYDIVRGRLLLTFAYIIMFALLGQIVKIIFGIILLFSPTLAFQILIEFISIVSNVYFIVAQYVLFINYKDTAHFYRPQIAQE